nr:ribosomal protein L36 [Oryza sativa Indica Group]
MNFFIWNLDIFAGTFFLLFRKSSSFFERLPLSLFMLRIGTNDSNSSTPTNQSTFCTNFTNRSSYFHISVFLS